MVCRSVFRGDGNFPLERLTHDSLEFLDVARLETSSELLLRQANPARARRPWIDSIWRFTPAPPGSCGATTRFDQGARQRDDVEFPFQGI